MPPTTETQLAAQGLRAASAVEAGWYVVVSVNGQAKKVWATDARTRSHQRKQVNDMAQYQIISIAGVVLGIYEGETAAEALDAMARDAGYASQAEAEGTVGAFYGTFREIDADD